MKETIMRRRDFIRLAAGLSAAGYLQAGGIAEDNENSAALGQTDAATRAGKNIPYYGVFHEVGPLSVKPAGWLREMLERQMNGLAHHHAASGYPYDTCLWAGKIPASVHGAPWWPYEQTGYLVDGLERLGIITGDSATLAEARANLSYILRHPRTDGSLGPDHIGDINWPHAVVFRALLAEYDATHDSRIPEALCRHYLGRPVSYGKGRDVCNVEAMLRIYAVTGDENMLRKAQQTYANFDQEKSATSLDQLSNDSVIHEHGVTFNETAKLPALLYMYTGQTAMLEASIQGYHKIDRDHMLASGLHSAEEGTKGNSADLYHETCDISDYTWSVGYLLLATGDPSWADRLEKAVFNAGLGAISKDFKAHQYFSTPNQIVAAQGVETIIDEYRTAYRPGHVTECCSGNVHRFLPNYALRQWLRTPRGGIVAALYGPSRFNTYVDGVNVSIEQETEYPFSESVQLNIRATRPVEFPLHLRIPEWTIRPSITVNGKTWDGLCTPGSFATISRTFRDGDVISLELPMPVRARYWSSNGISIERGPLVYALKIKEDAKAVQGFKTTPDFPAWDIRPASAWNYGLALKGYDISDQVKVLVRPIASGSPWDVDNSPIELEVPAMLIPDWKLPNKTNPKLPENPVGSGPQELVRLVPYGATRIRLTVFPLL